MVSFGLATLLIDLEVIFNTQKTCSGRKYCMDMMITLLVVPYKDWCNRHRDSVDDYDDEYSTDYIEPAEAEIRFSFFDSDWIYEFFTHDVNPCQTNPCQNNGICKRNRDSYMCSCPEPYTGSKCDRVKNTCQRINCNQGECLVMLRAPYYQCSCRYPYQPPLCRKASSACQPNPCKNGGTCQRHRLRYKFSCNCPEGFRGKFCELGAEDCFEQNGHTYRGNVSQTILQKRCLHWNSHFLLDSSYNAFMEDADYYGLGDHNFCRNPDGDDKPWCFVNVNNKLKWDFCDVLPCLSTGRINNNNMVYIQCNINLVWH
uniref:Uncharacterized protein n=1 Tax=Naja naja TaxID=35670 RepID=A0A8C7DXX8_NAJNA